MTEEKQEKKKTEYVQIEGQTCDFVARPPSPNEEGDSRWFFQYSFYVRSEKVKKIQEAIHRKLYTIPLAKIKTLGTRVLEVGCGPGLESLILQHDGLFAVATDIDAEIPAKILVPMGIERIVRCDAAVLPFKDKSFDLVYSCGVMEHFSDDIVKTMLAEQVRVAKYAYFEVPLLELRIITPHLWDQGEYWYTREEWVGKVMEMGFKIVDTTSREWNTYLGAVLCSQ